MITVLPRMPCQVAVTFCGCLPSGVETTSVVGLAGRP
jgi:hypothetical protein